MGARFTNFQVRSDSTGAVCDALKPLVKTRAFVSPPQDGWVTVYDETCDKQNVAENLRVASGLSRAMKTAVFGFMVHASDVAVYWLFQSGELVDEFNSRPDYFKPVDDTERQRLRGRPEVLLPFCVGGTALADVKAIIHPAEGPPLFAESLITDLAKLLGIDDSRASLGFNYFEEEGKGILPDADKFQLVGLGGPSERERRMAALRSQPMPDPLVSAIMNIIQRWDWGPESEESCRVAARISGRDENEVRAAIMAQPDNFAREVLAKSPLSASIAFDELITARDQGPESLAALLGARVPALLTDIAIIAMYRRSEPFIEALIKHGLNPGGTAFNNETPLNFAKRMGTESTIYKMLKAAEKP